MLENMSMTLFRVYSVMFVYAVLSSSSGCNDGYVDMCLCVYAMTGDCKALVCLVFICQVLKLAFVLVHV